MTTQNPPPRPARPSPGRDALHAELFGTPSPNMPAVDASGTDATSRADVAAVAAPAPVQRPQAAPLLDVLAARGRRPADAIDLLTVASDGRISLSVMKAHLDWAGQPGDLAVYRDRTSTRVWLAPTPPPCACANCTCAEVPPPSPRFVAEEESTAVVQSQHRLKLSDDLWEQLHAGRTGQVLAVATDGALVLASSAALSGALLADVTTTTTSRTGHDADTARDDEQPTQATRPHLEVVA